MPLPGHPRISIDPAVCGGRPVIAGTRMRVCDLLEGLASGDTEAEIVADFPYVSVEDVPAALAWAAEVVNDPAVRVSETIREVR